MSNFSDVVDFLNSLEDAEENNRLERINKPKIDRLRSKYPAIPNDFLDFLAEVGAGSFDDCRYMIYGDLLKPSDIFNPEDVAEIEDQILLFGDDFAGNPAGFLVNKNWNIAEILHENIRISEDGSTFGEFIRRKIGMEDD